MKRMWVDAALGGTRDQKTRLYGWEVLLPEYPGLTFVAVKLPSGVYSVYETTCGASLVGWHLTLKEAVADAQKSAKTRTYAEVQAAVRSKIVARATRILGE